MRVTAVPLVQPHAQAGRGPRQAEAVLQRVQVARARVVRAGHVARAGDPAAAGRRVRSTAAGSRSGPARRSDVGPQLARLALAGGHAEVAIAPVAVDGEARAALADQVERLDRHAEHALGRVAAELGFDRRLVAGQAVDRLAAVAAAGAPADFAALRAAPRRSRARATRSRPTGRPARRRRRPRRTRRHRPAAAAKRCVRGAVAA